MTKYIITFFISFVIIGYTYAQNLEIRPNIDGTYSIPLTGNENRDWFIANYIDKNCNKHDFHDFKNGFMTYDSHQGIDFTLSNFKTMTDGIFVKASRSGVIESLHDGEFDHQTKTNKYPWNYIKIRHTDNSYAYYGHLKKNSIYVKIGQYVKRGQYIAKVGSSGSSSHPHLHLEIRDYKHQVIDIFQSKLINFSYHYPYHAYVFEEGMTYKDDKNIDEDYYHFTPSKLYAFKEKIKLIFWIKIIGLKLNDKIRISVLNEDDIEKFFYIIKSNKNYKYSYWHVNMPILRKGIYKIKVAINKKNVEEKNYKFIIE